MISAAVAVLFAAPMGPAMARPPAAPPAGAGAQAPTGSATDTSTTTTTPTTTTQRGPDHTGQPSVECGAAGALNRPGNAETAPGSAFNPDGHAGQVYAGEQPQNSRNTASVSQYDSACAHQR